MNTVIAAEVASSRVSSAATYHASITQGRKSMHTMNAAEGNTMNAAEGAASLVSSAVTCHRGIKYEAEEHQQGGSAESSTAMFTRQMTA